MAKEAHTPELWCVNITGPDDVIAVSSRAEAVDLAARFNDVAVTKFEAAPHEYDPLMWAVPMPWPHSAESHAENLGDLGEYAWVRARPAPAATVAPELLELARDYRGAIEYYARRDMKGGDIEGARLKQFTMKFVDSVIAKAGATP
jgi:hypothetical protein